MGRFAVGSAGALYLAWPSDSVRRWTFRAHDVSHTTSASRYALVQLVAALANVGLLYAFVDGALKE